VNNTDHLSPRIQGMEEVRRGVLSIYQREYACPP